MNDTDKGRVRVFADLGFPFDEGHKYDWNGVRARDGALLMQVSTDEAGQPGAWPNAIPILDDDADAKARYPKSTLHRHFKRKDDVQRVRGGSVPVFIILAKMTYSATGRESTRSIDPHQVYRVLGFFNGPYRGHPDAVFAKIDPSPVVAP